MADARISICGRRASDISSYPWAGASTYDERHDKHFDGLIEFLRGCITVSD
jgi:hypothetical protein